MIQVLSAVPCHLLDAHVYIIFVVSAFADSAFLENHLYKPKQKMVKSTADKRAPTEDRKGQSSRKKRKPREDETEGKESKGAIVTDQSQQMSHEKRYCIYSTCTCSLCQYLYAYCYSGI